MANSEKIRRIIETLLEEHFDNVHIVSVTVTPEVDEDGDKILLVNVVFDGDPKTLDARKTAGLARHALPKIHDAGETGFPVFSFIANSEMRKRKAEAH